MTIKSILDWLKGEVAWFERHGQGDKLLAEFFVAAAAGNYRTALEDLMLACLDFSEGTQAEVGVRKLVAELKSVGILTAEPKPDLTPDSAPPTSISPPGNTPHE